MKIIAIGRNYVKHIEELNNEVPQEPVFFMKPETAVLRNNEDFYYPEFSKNIHYEVELVFKICKTGKHILPEFAHKYYNEIGIGIDFTARDLQDKCKSKGLPWEIAKAFDNSAPISNKFIPKTDFANINDINFSLTINDKIVQQASSKLMIFKIDTIIAYVSQFVILKTGDLIFTGTPQGVAEIKIGDRLTAKIENETLLDFHIK